MSQLQQTVLRVQTNNTATPEYTILDLYSSIPIKIDRTYAELQDITKKNSDTALNVILPGSKKNNRFFENFFDVDTQSYSFSAIKKVMCQVLINDETYFNGYLRLNKITIQDTKVEYDVSLYSIVGNLFGDIGNNLLKDLDYADPEYTFNHIFNTTSVMNYWNYSNFSKNDEQPEPYLYPIVHNGYVYDGNSVILSGQPQNVTGATVDAQTRLYTSSPLKAGSYATAAAAFSAGVQQYHLNSPGQGLINNQLKPALSIWNMMQLLFKTYGYKIKSDFMNTPWMKTLYMYGYYSANLTKFSYQVNEILTLPPSGVDVIVNPSTGLTAFDLIVVQQGTGVPCFCDSEIQCVIEIKRRYHGFLGFQFTQYYNQTFTIYPTTSGSTITLDQSTPANTIYRHYNQSISATSGFINVGYAPLTSLKYFPVSINEFVNYDDGDYVNFSLVIDSQFKQIDFLSSIARKFNLIFVPDPYVPNQIIIEPYSHYIGTGDVWDWTDKLAVNQGFSVEPALNYIDSYYTFYDIEDGDYGNVQFKNKNSRIYGQKFVPNNTNFKSTTGETKTTFSPEIFRQWDAATNPDGTPTASGQIRLPLGINYAGSTSESGVNVFYQYTGVKTKPKLMWWLQGTNLFSEWAASGKTYNYSFSATTYTVWIGNSSGTTYFKEENAPIVSNAMPIGMKDQYKINNDSLSILFNAEELAYIDVFTYNTYTNNDTYGAFYANRINNLYNPNTRFLKGKFYLKLSDYKNLKPNDLIKIKDQYFTWNKINGYNLTNVELTEVELVQSNLNPQKYPTRYFKYQYCDAAYTFVIATDFTNPILMNTQFGWSIMYDNNSAVVFGNNAPTGFTTTVTYQSGGLTYYVPFFISEITEQEALNSGYYDITQDQLMNYVYSIVNGPFGENMPTYYINSGSTLTGLNLFTNCASFASIAARDGIRVGSSGHFGPPLSNARDIQTELTEDIQTQNNENIQTQN